MKFSYIYPLFALCFGAFLLLNNSMGAAEVQGNDRTRSPLSENTSCQTCHNSGAFSPTISVEMLDGTEAISTYVPGQMYTLRVKITPTTGTPARYGFQAVALMGDNNLKAGNYGTPPSGIQVIDLNGRDYAEQSMPNTTDGNFEIEWQAPNEGSGPVRIYASGNAANGNGTSGGDGGVTLQTPLTLSEGNPSAISAPEALFSQLSIAPNPVQNQMNLSIDNPERGTFQVIIRSLDGRQLQKRQLHLQAGQQVIPWEVANLNSGLYLLQLTDGQKVSTLKFVKQ